MLIRILGLLCVVSLLPNVWASDYFIEPGRMFTPDGIIGPGDSLEKGEINGIDYRFFLTDGSGRVGNWDVKCERDKMSERRSCTMWYSYDDLTVSLSSNGKMEVLVGIEHFPRTSVFISSRRLKATCISSARLERENCGHHCFKTTHGEEGNNEVSTLAI